MGIFSAIGTALGGPVGGALASAAGGLITGSGASKAADAQAEAAERSAQVQWDMYNQTRADQGPYRDVGANALYRLADHYGLGYGTDPATVSATPAASSGAPLTAADPSFYTLNQTPYLDTSNIKSGFVGAFANRFNESGGLGGGFGVENTPGWIPLSQSGNVPSTGVIRAADLNNAATNGPYSLGNNQADAWNHFFTSPDYQFRLDEGIRGIENSMLARGKGLSGNTAKAITGYSGDLASGEWNNYANRLASLAGVGQTATNNLGAFGASAAQGVGNANIQAGQARGSGYIGQADAWGNALEGIGDAAGWGNWGGGSGNWFSGSNTPYAPPQNTWNSLSF